MKRVNLEDFTVEGDTNLTLKEQIALEIVKSSLNLNDCNLFMINGIYQLPHFEGFGGVLGEQQLPHNNSIPFGGYLLLDRRELVLGRMIDLRGSSSVYGTLSSTLDRTAKKLKMPTTLNLKQKYDDYRKPQIEYSFRENENGIFIGEYNYKYGSKQVKGKAACQIEHVTLFSDNISDLFKT